MNEAVPTSGQAPAGRVLCRLEDIEDGQGKGFTLGEGLEARDIFVVRDGDQIYGYVNSCPHQGTPLDWQGDRFISEENGLIMCATHGAQFEWADGTCVSGPCAGANLEAVAVTLDENGRVVLDET
ncbi:MAG: Rieske (2Fe-2S) protein [Kiloniellales bacterium]